jgi:hypothetical protein
VPDGPRGVAGEDGSARGLPTRGRRPGRLPADDPTFWRPSRRRGPALPGGRRIVGKYAPAIADLRKALTLKVDEPLKKQIETALKELGLPG